MFLEDEGERSRWLARLLGSEFLLWTPYVQEEAFLHWQRIFATRSVRASRPIPLREKREQLSVVFDSYRRKIGVTDLMQHEHLSGLIVLHEGEIALERYRLGLSPQGTWQSSSMVKSLTSILIGAALYDGHISSLDDAVITHIPELADCSAYEGVTLRHVLQMSTGTHFSEDYEDLQSDVNQKYLRPIAAREPGAILEGLKRSRRVADPGTRFAYNTGDTYLLSLVLSRAVGMSVSDFCSERVWAPMGMELDGYFMLDSDDGHEVTGSCSGASLRDYARIGQLMLNDGVAANGERILPEGWVAESTMPSAPNFEFDLWEDRSAGFKGYGYLWWVLRPGSFSAIGVYGQWLHVVPDHNLVIVMLGAMPREGYMHPDEPVAASRGNQHGSLARVAFIDAVIRHYQD